MVFLFWSRAFTSLWIQPLLLWLLLGLFIKVSGFPSKHRAGFSLSAFLTTGTDMTAFGECSVSRGSTCNPRAEAFEDWDVVGCALFFLLWQTFQEAASPAACDPKGMCCHFSHVQSCDPMDCRSPGFSVHGILQTRTLAWGVTSFSRGSSPPGHRTWVSSGFCTGRRILYHGITWEALKREWNRAAYPRRTSSRNEI